MTTNGSIDLPPSSGGATGPTGPTGPAGASGASGATGPTGPSGIASIGALDSQAANAQGLTLVAGVLSTQSADATHPGMLNITTQTIDGIKTFATGLVIGNSLAYTVTNNSTSSGSAVALPTPTAFIRIINSGFTGLSFINSTGIVNGQVINIYNDTGSAITVHDSASSPPGGYSQINTVTSGSSVVLAVHGSIQLFYSISIDKWVFLSGSLYAPGGAFNTIQYNSGGSLGGDSQLVYTGTGGFSANAGYIFNLQADLIYGQTFASPLKIASDTRMQFGSLSQGNTYNDYTYILHATHASGTSQLMKDGSGNLPLLGTDNNFAATGIITGYSNGLTGSVGNASIYNCDTNDGATVTIPDFGAGHTYTLASNGSGTPAVSATQMWTLDGAANQGTYTINGTAIGWNNNMSALQAVLDFINPGFYTANAGYPNNAVTWVTGGAGQTALTLVSSFSSAVGIGGYTFTDGDGVTPAVETWNLSSATIGTYSLGATVNYNDSNSTLQAVIDTYLGPGVATLTGNSAGYILTWSDPAPGKTPQTVTNIDLGILLNFTSNNFNQGTNAVLSNTQDLSSQINSLGTGINAHVASGGVQVQTNAHSAALNGQNLTSAALSVAGWANGITDVAWGWATYSINGAMYSATSTGTSIGGGFTVTQLSGAGGGTVAGLTCSAAVGTTGIEISVANSTGRSMFWSARLDMTAIK